MRYIYITTNLVNGMSYIGQRKTPNGKTPQQDSYLGSGTRLLYAIKKYNRKNFKKVILHECITQAEADRLEIYEIESRKALEDKTKFYNISPGGQFGRSEKHSEITSKSMTEYYANDENYAKWIIVTNKKRRKKGFPDLPYNTREEMILYKREVSIFKAKKRKMRKKALRFKQNIPRCIHSIVNNSPENLYIRAITRKAHLAKVVRDQWNNEGQSRTDMLVRGRRDAAIKRKSQGDTHWSKEAIDSFAMAKLRQYHNYLTIYLISKGMRENISIWRRIKNMNANEYSSKRELDVLNRLVLSINNVSSDIISLDHAKKLINEARIAKNKPIIP